MTDSLMFVSLSLALLLTPGPTNTVLAVAGATSGLRASLLLVPAEMLGYLAAIHILAFGIGPLIPAAPITQTAIRLACALYLVGLAFVLWRTRAPLIRQEAITPRRVFIVTLLNPKALVFTFVILPGLPGHWLAALPTLAGLCGLIAMASLSWISLGGAIRSGRIVRVSPQGIRRIGAAILTLFALIIATSRAAIGN